MAVHPIREKASAELIAEMLAVLGGYLGGYIELAVELDRPILAGGGALHADCESALLEAGSQQEAVRGADWVLSSRKVHFETLINLRPRQHNVSMSIQDPEVRDRVEHIARNLLEFQRQLLARRRSWGQCGRMWEDVASRADRPLIAGVIPRGQGSSGRQAKKNVVHFF